jgi:hypothetical protein
MKWEEHDDPWVEHERWYKNCYHLELSRHQPPKAPEPQLLNQPTQNFQSGLSLKPVTETTLLEEPLKSGQGGDDCVVCLDGGKTILFLPCSHLVCCPGCAKELISCPMCREVIVSKIHVYKC